MLQFVLFSPIFPYRLSPALVLFCSACSRSKDAPGSDTFDCSAVNGFAFVWMPATALRPSCNAARIKRSPSPFSSSGLGCIGFVTNHFDVVPVRTNDESCIVVGVILRAHTRRTIVFATRFQSRAIESVDLLAILCRER